MDIHIGHRHPPFEPGWLRARLAKWPLVPYRLGLGSLIAHKILILTTTGRITQRSYRTPLWYVYHKGIIYCLAGRGGYSDWVKNIVTSSQISVRIGNRVWESRGELIDEESTQEKKLHMFYKKYGHLARLYYRPKQTILVAFPLNAPNPQHDIKNSISRGGS